MSASVSELDQFIGVEDAAPVAPRQAIAKVSYNHDAMINMLIARQGRISQGELAKYFGVTESWLSQIMSSDAFQARFAERTKELVDPAIRDEAQAGFREVLRISQELLLERLNSRKVSDTLLIKSTEVAGRALGYGAREQTINNNFVQNNVEQHLEVLGDRMTGLLQRRRQAALDPSIELITQESSQ